MVNNPVMRPYIFPQGVVALGWGGVGLNTSQPLSDLVAFNGHAVIPSPPLTRCFFFSGEKLRGFF